MVEQGQKIWSDYYYLIYGIFYFAQGFAFAMILLIAVFMQNVMAVPAEDAIGYQSIIMIPWYIKLIYGFISDNTGSKRFGRRKPYLLIAGTLGIIGWFLFPTFKQFSSTVLIVGISLSLCVALSDAMLDSIACDITPENKRGKMQGVGWGFRGLGSAIAGVVLGLTIDRYGWNIGFYIPGFLVVIACFISLLFKEPKIEGADNIVNFDGKAYKDAFRSLDTWIVTLFMIISGAGIAIVMVFATFLNIETGMNIEMIGYGFSSFAIGQFVGAIIIGLVSEKINTFKMMTAESLIYIGFIALLLVVPITNSPSLYLLIAGLGAINGGYEAIQMRIGMDYSALNKKITGSMYNWYMSISNVGQSVLGALAIAANAETAGYRTGMQTASLFLALAVLIGYYILKKRYPKIQVK
jgi:MFS family permease